MRRAKVSESKKGERKRNSDSKLFSLRSILNAFGILMGMAAAAGFFGSWWWVFDACSHFRVQYFFGFLGIGALFAWQKKKAGACLAAAGAGVNLFVVLPHLLETNPQSWSVGQSKIRILWWNVHSDNKNVQNLFDLIEEESPDLIAFAEVNSDWKRSLDSLKESYPYHCVEDREDNFGIALYARMPLAETQILRREPNGVPTIQTEIMLEGRSLCLIATHPVPPVGSRYTQSRNRQLAWLSRLVKQMRRPTVVVGDLNTTPWNHAFKSLAQTARLNRPAGVFPTWPANFPLLAIPLDHCLVTSEICVARKRIGPNLGSDHKPLIVDLVWRRETTAPR